MFTKSIFVSDIANEQGDKINPSYFHNAVHKSKLNWPSISYPPEVTWKTW